MLMSGLPLCTTIDGCLLVALTVRVALEPKLCMSLLTVLFLHLVDAIIGFTPRTVDLSAECFLNPSKRVLLMKPRSYKIDLGSLARQVTVAEAPGNIVHTIVIAVVRGMGTEIKVRGGQRARRTCLTIAVEVRRDGMFHLGGLSMLCTDCCLCMRT